MKTILLLPSALAEVLDAELRGIGAIKMEISDSAVDGFYHLAEHVDCRCPECGCPLAYDYESDAVLCPKCNWKDHN